MEIPPQHPLSWKSATPLPICHRSLTAIDATSPPASRITTHCAAHTNQHGASRADGGGAADGKLSPRPPIDTGGELGFCTLAIRLSFGHQHAALRNGTPTVHAALRLASVRGMSGPGILQIKPPDGIQ